MLNERNNEPGPQSKGKSPSSLNPEEKFFFGYSIGDLWLHNAGADQHAAAGKLQKDSQLRHFNCSMIAFIFLSQCLVSLEFYGC